MSNGKQTWSTIGQTKGKGNKSNDLVFLTAKNLPQTFLPSQDVVIYESVFDQATQKSRPPQPGEKAKIHFLFYGLSLNEKGEKVVKIYDCGKQVADGIATVNESLKNLGLISFVNVTAAGTGLNTEYKVVAAKVVDKPIPADIWTKLEEHVKKLPTLEEMRDRLLGLAKKEDKEGEAVASGGGSVSGLNTSNTLEI